MREMGENGWSEWENHVLAELKRLGTGVDNLTEKVGETRAEIAMLKVKASIWGALAGSIPTTIAIIWYILSRGIG